ncbi:hypothetical protein J19TS2_26780 [Cohnella xylanilytica]|uniref:DJ-1/PfpI family protein n=1 Tax=Cohnella xylanilytica TaxID=557555 RepID=A0A841UBD9_9BACL|nr:DJ-1/PfpI family protein [Cohnella xylanilytica]MBB6695271.1 DJ-1/PfpI family protein [Cohnella xylanilytica]GIO13123.1 hypothetical protein J19TS2_26780 [Cohnella xylanilytica]
MLNVQIVLFDGFDLLDALAPYEVFSAAAAYSDHAITVELVTAEGPRSVPSGVGGLRIEASGRLEPERGGILLVPGAAGDAYGQGPDSVPAILGRAMITELTGRMRQAMERPDVVVATVCGGSLLLAMGGLLEGRHAVTHHLGMGVFGATGAIPVPARVVDDGDLVSGGGVTSGFDVALYLVERELGPRIAHEVERLFEYERRGTAWRAQGMAPIVGKPPADEEPAREAGSAEAASAVPTMSVPTSSGGQASVFDGEWDASIATPVGKLEVRFSISTRNGQIEGTASQGGETVELQNPVLAGGNLLWTMRVSKPMRLNLKFEVAVDGDRMIGIAKAGILPASKLTGHRVS